MWSNWYWRARLRTSAGRKQAAKAEAPVIRKCRLESSVLTDHLLLKMGEIAQERIPQHAGYTRVAGMEATADPALGVVGQVLGVVDPPGAVIIPEVVERIVGGGPDGEDGLVDGCCAHVGVMCGWSHQEPGQQKSAVPSGKALHKAWRDFCSEDFSLRTSSESLHSATVGFLRPRLASLGFTQGHS